jgi:hypothetical protein
MIKDTRHPDRMGRQQPGFEDDGVRPVPPPTQENEKPTGHEQQVRRQSDTSPPLQGRRDTGMSSDETGRNRKPHESVEGVSSNEAVNVSPSNAGSQNKPTSDYERSPSGTPKPKPANQKDRDEKESHGREETKDARSPDNPYGGDPRYEADFAHSGYGGPGVGSDKG